MPTNAEYLKQRREDLASRIKQEEILKREANTVAETRIECLQDELKSIDKQIASRKGLKTKSKKKE